MFVVKQVVYLPVAGGANVDGWAGLGFFLFDFLSGNQMMNG